jgi:hypothetical protein
MKQTPIRKFKEDLLQEWNSNENFTVELFIKLDNILDKYVLEERDMIDEVFGEGCSNIFPIFNGGKAKYHSNTDYYAENYE